MDDGCTLIPLFGYKPLDSFLYDGLVTSSAAFCIQENVKIYSSHGGKFQVEDFLRG